MSAFIDETLLLNAEFENDAVFVSSLDAGSEEMQAEPSTVSRMIAAELIDDEQELAAEPGYIDGIMPTATVTKSGTVSTLTVKDKNGTTQTEIHDGEQGPAGPPGTTTWEGITNKPATFPPSDHSHDGRYYTEAETDNLLSNKETTSNKVTSISGQSTNTQYPSAKCVYDAIQTAVIGAIEGSY